MLCCTETATLVHHTATPDGDRYTCTAMVGVSWHGKRRESASANGGEAPREEYVVRIPAEVVPEALPEAGDYLVRGILAEYTGRRCLKGREWFCISTVGDNRRGRHLAHMVVKNT